MTHLREAATPRSETQIVKAILDYLKTVPGVFAWRNNTGGAYYGEQLVRFGVPGMSDILGWKEISIVFQGTPVPLRVPQFLALEVKVPGWKPRNKKDELRWSQQQAFLQRVKNAGGIAAMVTSVDDVIAALGR